MTHILGSRRYASRNMSWAQSFRKIANLRLKTPNVSKWYEYISFSVEHLVSLQANDTEMNLAHLYRGKHLWIWWQYQRIYIWNTSEHIVFWPSSVWRPRAIGVNSMLMLWSCVRNANDMGPVSIYFRSGSDCLHHSVCGSSAKRNIADCFCVKFDTPRVQAALDSIKATGYALSVSWKGWKPCVTTGLDSSLVLLFLHLGLELMLTIVAFWKVCC